MTRTSLVQILSKSKKYIPLNSYTRCLELFKFCNSNKMLFPYTNVDLVSEIQGRFKVWISCQQKWGGVINNTGT